MIIKKDNLAIDVHFVNAVYFPPEKRLWRL